MELSLLPVLLGLAVLLPFVSFWIILFGANVLKEKAAWVATSAIAGAGFLSFVSFLFIWLPNHWPASAHHEHHHEGEKHAAVAGLDPLQVAYLAEDAKAEAGHKEEHKDTAHKDEHGKDEHKEDGHGKDGHHHEGHAESPAPITGVYYTLGSFGKLQLDVSYYIDSLTVCMFCMVTFIATCIHFYAMGYMHDELHDITDHEVHMADDSHLKRPGRFPRFFQALSLFCFSMLGLVLAGNIALVFVFWELVGICSFFLIGFYIERKSASTAANKAFIVNRVGDFGMIIGLMALWASLGTFSFGDIDYNNDKTVSADEHGLFSQLRPEENHHKLTLPEKMIKWAGSEKAAAWLLFVAGVGIFCGCVGKSAQFPLHVWLPDAMEGPTPVSALVHSATMVAAGVYLVGRFFPAFSPEVLLVIASIGCITLFIAASIAITATDIKRVLAYSTVSQLGYMMLALGLGGWAAGLMHLITHAFFKSLLFMCSGSVIHAVHTNDMRRMGGLLKKMPVTAITMLIGCIAIAGVGVPFVIGFSGYYSKDLILEAAYYFHLQNESPYAGIFFYAAAGGAAMTAFYMFRMWYLTFVGKPRDQHAYDHAHESPPIMFMPLIILSVLAISVAWDFTLIGYGAIAAGFFIVKGMREGWFKGSASHGHGHDDHGHSDHGHDSHGHDKYDAHASHANHGHDAHGHDDHSHGEHAPAGSGLSVGWVLTMLAVSFVGGAVVQTLLVGILPEDSKLVSLNLSNLLEQARPAGTLETTKGLILTNWTWPNEHDSHSTKTFVTILATGTWFAGIFLATMMYGLGYLNAEEVRRQFAPVYTLLVNKWWFDELYNAIFIQPVMLISRLISGIDRNWIDWLLDSTAKVTVWFSKQFEFIADRGIVDGTANLIGNWCYSTGLSLRQLQTGKIRQYVLFIVMGAIAIFVLIAAFWGSAPPPQLGAK